MKRVLTLFAALALGSPAFAGSYRVVLQPVNGKMLVGHAGVQAVDETTAGALVRLITPGNQVKERGTVRVLVRNQPNGPTLEVIDTGPGIAAEHQEYIFDRFYRVDKARSRELGGTGLGLSIVRWAVEVHGGCVELESEEGKGSLFRIRLPSPQEHKGE